MSAAFMERLAGCWSSVSARGLCWKMPGAFKGSAVPLLFAFIAENKRGHPPRQLTLTLVALRVASLPWALLFFLLASS